MRAFHFIRQQWVRLMHFLAKVNTILLLAIVYFVLITPLGLVLRMFKKLQYQHALRPKRSSLWIDATEQPSAEDLTRPF